MKSISPLNTVCRRYFRAILIKTFKVIALSSLLTQVMVNTSFAYLPQKEYEEAMKEANDAVGKYIGDYSLIDQDGRRFSLKEFSGKPLVVSFIYTQCSHICPTITMHLKLALKDAGNDLGAKFNAITIGFDTDHDTPAHMKSYGQGFTNDFKSWRFATADKETIARMTKEFGFFYKKINGGFEHINTVTIVDAQGKIYKHVYGLDFSSRELLEPLYQSLRQTDGDKKIPAQGIINKLKLFCYRYDPITGTYVLDYAMVSALILGITAQFAIIFMIVYLVLGKEIKRLLSRKVKEDEPAKDLSKEK